MRITRFSLLTFALIAFAAGAAMAEGPQRGKDFYEKNFAETPLKPREGGKFPDGSFPTPIGRMAQPGSQGNPGPSLNMEQMQKLIGEGKLGEWQKEMGITPPTPTPKADEEAYDLTGLTVPLPVRSIGGILNSLDADHYQENIKHLAEFAIAKDLNVGTIYALGDMKVASDSPYLPKLMARGGNIKIVSNIPEGYEVSMSPTWILKTDKGEVLLEGVADFEKFFNSTGAFLDREKREAKAS